MRQMTAGVVLRYCRLQVSGTKSCWQRRIATINIAYENKKSSRSGGRSTVVISFLHFVFHTIYLLSFSLFSFYFLFFWFCINIRLIWCWCLVYCQAQKSEWADNFTSTKSRGQPRTMKVYEATLKSE
ncbi:hypothetical protein V1511DRAFT_363942 [Dipodascopsis uninucleata]